MMFCNGLFTIHVFANLVKSIFFSDEEDEDECKGCDKEQEECVCKSIMDNFHAINQQL